MFNEYSLDPKSMTEINEYATYLMNEKKGREKDWLNEC